MLKQYYEQMKNGLEAQYQQKPRAWTKINIELASSFLNAYADGARVAWTSYYSFPMELLAAFDIAPFDFEIATNLLPALDADGSVNVMSRAEEEGYSTDLCSFHRLAMGCQLLGYMPRADILLSSTYFCDGKARLNQILAQYHGKEDITLDVPNKIDKESIAYVAAQLRYIAGKLEEVCGHKLDPERLRACIRACNRGRAAYGQLAEIQKSSPFPWNGINVLNMCIFGNMLNGRPVQEQLYLDLVAECRNKLDSGTLAPEKFRIFWLAWYPPQPTNIGSILRKNGVSIIMGEQARIYWDEMDEQRPFESMALRCMQNPYVGPIEQRLAGIMKIVGDYNPDGVIHFSVDACRHSSAGQRLIRDALEKRGVPFMVLDGDMSDKRKYSSDRTQFLLENFIEVMAARK